MIIVMKLYNLLPFILKQLVSKLMIKFNNDHAIFWIEALARVYQIYA